MISSKVLTGAVAFTAAGIGLAKTFFSSKTINEQTCSNGMVFDPDPNQPLWSERKRIIEKMIAEKLPMDKVCIRDCEHPLLYAIVVADVELVLQILQKGNRLNVNVRGSDSLTPLHLAASNIIDDEDACVIARALIENGADTEDKNEDVNWKGGSGGDAAGGGAGVKAGVVVLYETGGRTCLHLAASHGCTKLINLLLDAGAEALVWDNDGNTPLSLLEQAYARMKRNDETKMMKTMGNLNNSTSVNKLKEMRIAEVEQAMARLKQILEGEENEEKSGRSDGGDELRRRNRSRNARITRKGRRMAKRMRMETIATIKREFDWQGMNIFNEEAVLDPLFLQAWQQDHKRVPEQRLALRKLLYRPAPDHPDLRVWAFTMLREDFCTKLMGALDRFEAYKKKRGLKIRRSGSRYGALFNHVGFQKFFDTLVRNYLRTLAEIVYPEECKEFHQQHTFLVSYEVSALVVKTKIKE